MHGERGCTLPSEKRNERSESEQSEYERDEIVLLTSALNPLLFGVAQRSPPTWDRRQVYAHPRKIFAPPPLSGAFALGISTPPIPPRRIS
jgi:hypothetical protein